MNDIRYLIASLKRASLQGLSIITLPYRGRETQVLSILHAGGFIQSFERRGQYIIVYLKQTYWVGWGRTLKSLQSIDPIIHIKKPSISASKYNKLTRNLGDAFCVVISTDRGLMTNADRSKQIGGILMFKAI